jgi:hypothetical protein
MAEFLLPLQSVALPRQFYDLQYSAVDIDEAIRVWAMNEMKMSDVQLAQSTYVTTS